MGGCRLLDESAAVCAFAPGAFSHGLGMIMNFSLQGLHNFSGNRAI